jgi:hypothetical protein
LKKAKHFSKIAKPLSPYGYPLTPHLGNRSFCQQRWGYNAFPSVVSAAFIRRCAHEEGGVPRSVSPSGEVPERP